MTDRTTTLKDTLPKTVEWMIVAGEEATAEKLETAQKAQRYQNRERIPESFLWMSDLYNELTKQEPTKRVLLDWLQTFEEWKQEHLEDRHIRAAWLQANNINKGFAVGRPGALTTTAVSAKSKMNVIVQPQINTEAIEYTRKLMEEKWGKEFVPASQELRDLERARLKARLAEIETKDQAERRNR